MATSDEVTFDTNARIRLGLAVTIVIVLTGAAFRLGIFMNHVEHELEKMTEAVTSLKMVADERLRTITAIEIRLGRLEGRLEDRLNAERRPGAPIR